jgi:hypothetical protein
MPAVFLFSSLDFLSPARLLQFIGFLDQPLELLGIRQRDRSAPASDEAGRLRRLDAKAIGSQAVGSQRDRTIGAV